MSKAAIKTQVAIIGAGPGGYPAAFHAADLGLDVTLIDSAPNPGGVCLYRGCIPSKALLHAASIIQQAREATDIGITFAEPKIDLKKLQAWKQSVVTKLTTGLGGLTKQRGITYVQGTATFKDAHSLSVETAEGTKTIEFEHAIIATGSIPVRPGLVPDSPRVMDSTNALEIETIPASMLVMGGGYIGLELGQAYAALGSAVKVVEMQASILPEVDPDLVAVLRGALTKQFDAIMLDTRVVSMVDKGDLVEVEFARTDGSEFKESFERVLVAVGRRPVSSGLGLDVAGVDVDERGFVKVDEHRRTSTPHILAIGDIAGDPMLAHKATHEGRVAAEIIHGGKAVYAPKAIPAVVFTDPEIAWCGLTEDEARRQGLNVRCGTFPWEASGRAATLDRPEGITKLITEAATGRILGMGVAGHNAGELIGEGVLAIEMGAVAEDIALSIHAHPSLSETIMEAAEQAMGQSTHFFQRM
jgi:dihydrolipoamide dehydrogenase